jgi:hypothetical protein
MSVSSPNRVSLRDAPFGNKAEFARIDVGLVQHPQRRPRLRQWFFKPVADQNRVMLLSHSIFWIEFRPLLHVMAPTPSVLPRPLQQDQALT